MNTFRQLRNDLRDIEAIADGYKTKIGHDLWLSDGLQKDAVQNSWDARIDKKHGTAAFPLYLLQETMLFVFLILAQQG